MHTLFETVNGWAPSLLFQRAPDFSGAPKRPRPRKDPNEFCLMCDIREIMKIVLVQFYQIYLISLFNYIGTYVSYKL